MQTFSLLGQCCDLLVETGVHGFDSLPEMGLILIHSQYSMFSSDNIFLIELLSGLNEVTFIKMASPEHGTELCYSVNVNREI